MDALNSIEGQLCAHVLASGVPVCSFSYSGSATRYPAVGMSWNGGSFAQNAGAPAARDLSVELLARIDAGDAASAMDCAQALEALWYDAGRFAELSALGVLSILPSRIEPPIALDGSAQVARATLAFNVRVRLT